MPHRLGYIGHIKHIAFHFACSWVGRGRSEEEEEEEEGERATRELEVWMPHVARPVPPLQYQQRGVYSCNIAIN